MTVIVLIFRSWMPPIVEHNDVFSWREIGGRATFRKINQGELDCELLQRQREVLRAHIG